MKTINVVVQWSQGLHARPATKLVQIARKYRSVIRVKTHEKAADAKSILSVLLLCATVGAQLEIEASGEDEHQAAAEIGRLFGVEGDQEDLSESIVTSKSWNSEQK